MRRGHTVKEETASNKDIYFSVSVFRRGEDSNVFFLFLLLLQKRRKGLRARRRHKNSEKSCD
jgi:hypothetical protein